MTEETMSKNDRPHWIDANDLIKKYEESDWKKPNREAERRATKLSAEELFELEPRLRDLFEETKAIRPKGPHFCANWTWSNMTKQKINELVGLGRGYDDPDANRLITTQAAHDIACRTIYEALPPCLDCWCFRPEDFEESGDQEFES